MIITAFAIGLMIGATIGFMIGVILSLKEDK